MGARSESHHLARASRSTGWHGPGHGNDSPACGPNAPRLDHLADHVTSFAKMITERTRSPGTGGLANTGGSRRPAGTALLCRRDPPRPRHRHRRAHPPLQQQVTQGLSVGKIGDPAGAVASSSRAWARCPRTRPSASRHRHDHSLPRHGAVRLAIPGRHRRSDLSWKASLATKLNDDDRHGDPGRRVRGANQCACRQARAATRTPRPIELSSRSPGITPPGVIPG